MGLFGKSKKEIELEEQDAWYQNNYDISKVEAESIERALRNRFSTDNLDLLLKFKAPIFNDIVKDIYTTMYDNKEKLNRIEKKYDALLEAINEQNKLLSMLVKKENPLILNEAHLR